MKISNWLLLFFLSLAVNLAGIFYQIDLLAIFSKPVIVISLLCLLVSKKASIQNRFFIPAALALLFSLLGDVLLIFEKFNALFFMLGLISFLVAHIFYIICFNRLRLAMHINMRWWIIPAVMVYYCSLIFILFPYLGEMKMPVIVYGAVISSMLLVALHLLFSDAVFLKLITLGAVLFVVSDSLLAFNKFYGAFKFAGVLIMLTYGLAQYFITTGELVILVKGSNYKEFQINNK